MNIWWNLLIFKNVQAFELIYPLSLEDYIIYSSGCLLLTIVSGLMSGLTVGLLSIDS